MEIKTTKTKNAFLGQFTFTEQGDFSFAKGPDLHDIERNREKAQRML